MKRISALVLLLLCGCSTHPVMDFLDYWSPGKLSKGKAQQHGGVCLPQGNFPQTVPAGPAVPSIAVPAPPVVPGPNPPPPPATVVPPPAPLPP